MGKDKTPKTGTQSGLLERPPSTTCGCDWWQVQYFRMYPSRRRDVIMGTAKRLQRIFLVFAWLHVLMVIVCFTLVGPWGMIMNSLCFAMAYSAYLNMKGSSIWTYYIILFIALGFGVWEFFDGSDT